LEFHWSQARVSNDEIVREVGAAMIIRDIAIEARGLNSASNPLSQNR
jgi:hypothetical protein